MVEWLLSLGGISAVVWFAVFAMVRLAVEPAQTAEPMRSGDAVALGFALLCGWFPVASLAGLAIFALGTYLTVTARATRSRRIAWILLALSGTSFWGKIVLLVFAPVLLALDGHIVGMLAGTGAQGNLVGFAGGGSFVIGGPCSSMHNISLALLLWTCVIALLDLRVDRRLVLVCGAAMAAMFALNVARLTAIALFPRAFDWLHVGTGATLFGWAGLVLAAGIVGGGAYDALARQR